MEVCFFNMYGFGDTLFSFPFIKHLCDNNKTKKFYYFVKYGHGIFNDIENISYIDEYTNKYRVKFKTGEDVYRYYDGNEYLKNLFNHNGTNNIFFTFEYNNKKILAFNVWCPVLGCKDDVEIISLSSKFKEHIDKVNIDFNLNLNTDMENIEILPVLPLNIKINKFDKWFETNKNRKLVYIYNYHGRSFDFIPIHIINYTIVSLANTFKDIIFIVPLYVDIFDNISNIKCCDTDFDCIETPDCNNLFMIEKILKYCEIVITVVSGASWVFFNSTLRNNNSNKKYLIQYNNSEKYCSKMNKWYRLATGNTNDVLQPIIFDDIFKLFFNPVNNLTIYKMNDNPISNDILYLINPQFFEIKKYDFDSIDTNTNILLVEGGISSVYKKILSFKYYKHQDIVGHDCFNIYSNINHMFLYMLDNEIKAFNTLGYIKNYIGKIEHNSTVGNGGIIVKTNERSNIYIHYKLCNIAIDKNIHHFNIIY